MSAIALRDVTKAVCQAFEISPEDLLGRADRKTRVTYPRFAFYELARRKTFRSVLDIGAYIGRDHGAVLHGIVRCAQVQETNQNFARRLRNAEAILQAPDFVGHKRRMRIMAAPLLSPDLQATG